LIFDKVIYYFFGLLKHDKPNNTAPVPQKIITRNNLSLILNKPVWKDQFVGRMGGLS
jgi:hypothetical protein